MKEQPVPGGSCEDSWVVSHFFLLLCVVCSSPVTSMEKDGGGLDRTSLYSRWLRSIALYCAAYGLVQDLATDLYH